MRLIIINIFILITLVIFCWALIFSKRIEKSKNWKATITPLASIIGSGFLIAAPLLFRAVGDLALPAMIILIVLAYGVGEAMRFNIRYLEPILKKPDTEKVAVKIEDFSKIAIMLAYFISVTYYLKLLSAFLLKGLGYEDPLLANYITSGILLTIGILGWWKGLEILESIEKYTVGLNLSIIGAFIIALIFYNLDLGIIGNWRLLPEEPVFNLKSLQISLGLLICVQGFETSRFLGAAYPPEQRIKTMRSAQIIAAFIYILFFGFTTVLFDQGFSGHGATAIIQISSRVALILPVLLVIAAIGSQFSASVADDAGAGGLVSEITHNRIPQNMAFLIIAAITLILTWTTNIYQIINFASRAFAFYYALQCLSASILAYKKRDLKLRPFYILLFPFMSIICSIVVLFGIPSG
jgi:hypothetical protein